MVKVIEGDLVLKKDTVFEDDLNVDGNITGGYDLKVKGNIDAWNINARNIDAWNINAWNIDAWNIDAEKINYYASCIVQESLKCSKIKGRRTNSIHKCLDQEIQYKKTKSEKKLSLEERVAKIEKTLGGV